MSINDYAFGIDISHWNGAVNFDVIKAHQPKVCFIAAKATESDYFKDDQFDYHWAEMKRIGVGRIAYHFVRFNKEAQPQVNKLLSATTDWDWEHDRIALDCEVAGGVSWVKITEIVAQAMQLLKQRTGRYPIIYSRKNWVDLHLDPSVTPIDQADWWLANYLANVEYPNYQNEKMPPPPLPEGASKWLIHQTGSQCRPIGVASHYLDYNRWNGTEADVRQYFGMDASKPEPVPEPPLERKVEMLWEAHPELHG
jgi:GH25 family lysozyme M1 (1,4-beta-N-acetylmuramidase)